MDWLERGIAAVAPVWAVQRAQARLALDMVRAYDAAKTGRRTENWRATNASANAEIGAGAARIRARTRDLVRNNPWAAQAVRKLSSKTIGTGIIPRLRVGKDEIERKRAAADQWNAFAENCDPQGQQDFYGLQRLAARTMYESGEVLVRYHYRPSSWNLPVPLQLELLEPDYIDSSITRSEANGNIIIQGIEFDKYGRRVAYRLFDEHPGEVISSWLKRGLQSHRVPASEISHIFDPLRPGQARGVSMFTAAALRLRDLDDYDDAELMRKKVAACFAAIVKRPASPTSSAAALGVSTTDEKGRKVETLNPGRIQYLETDGEITFANPPAAEGYMEFMTMQLHAVAAGTGVTYEQLSGDLSRANLSSLRAGSMDFWDFVDQQQWHVFIPQMCAPTWRRVGALLGATGKRNAAQDYPAVWTPPGRKYLDPQKDVAANRDAIRAGLATLRQKIAETGEDPDEVLSEQAETLEQTDALGLVLDSDPRKVSRGGGATSPGDGSGGVKAADNGDEKEDSNV